LPEKVVFEIIYTVSGGTLNPTHSLTHSLQFCNFFSAFVSTLMLSCNSAFLIIVL